MDRYVLTQLVRGIMEKKSKDKHNRWLTILWGSLIVVGVLLMLSAPIKNWLVAIGSDRLLTETVDASTIEENHQKDASFDFGEVEMLDMETVALAQFNSDQITVLGGISIPSVGLNLAIGKGTSPYTLALTAGTMKENQEMGKGNYALAGHYMNDPHLLFRPLYEVEIGDTVYLTDLSYIYEYKVIEQQKIEATEVSVIDDVPDKTLLTLITCDDNGVTRLWTSAEFVEKVSVDDATPEMLEAFDSDLSIRSR